MMKEEQYFSPRPESPHRPRSFEEKLGAGSFCFESEGGTFSHGRLDAGSRLLIETALKLPDFPQSGRILDLGAGWGPVGIALGKNFPHIELNFLEVNERALELAKKNFRKNLPGSKARFILADGLSGENLARIDPERESTLCLPDRAEIRREYFDLILQNPPIRAGKEVIYRLFAEAFLALRAGGRYLAVMRKKQGADSGFRELQRLYGEKAVETIARGKGYHILSARKGRL